MKIFSFCLSGTMMQSHGDVLPRAIWIWMSCRDDLDLDQGARDFQKLIVLVNPLHEIDKNMIGSDPVLTVHFNDE